MVPTQVETLSVDSRVQVGALILLPIIVLFEVPGGEKVGGGWVLKDLDLEVQLVGVAESLGVLLDEPDELETVLGIIDTDQT